MRLDPTTKPIEIYVLDDRAAFEHFLRFYYPELPTRRAFFLARGDRRVVYAYRGERLIEDLRHEATHALLHASVTDLPLWLDEGLAEYFEVPEERGGLNAEHYNRLPADLAAGWTPDLARLEALRDVRVMTPRDYRESWAWVHYLLDGPPGGRAALLGYLADLRAGLPALPLSARLDGAEGASAARMVAHLKQLDDRPLVARPAHVPAPVVTASPRTIIRGQDPTPEPSRRRGLFGRMMESLGLGRDRPMEPRGL
jgi:hypothetical protein